MIRVPFWAPRSPFGYAASAAIGLLVIGFVVYVVFDGRALSNVRCTESSCFQSRNLEAATAFAVALVTGSYIGTRLETVWLRAQNHRALATARGTEATYYGLSSVDVAAFLNNIPSYLVPERMTALMIAGDSEAAFEAMTKALRSAFSRGEALALELYVQRAQMAALAKMDEAAGLAGGPIVQSIAGAVALLVVKDYMSWAELLKAWKQYESVFGPPRMPGPTNWQAR